MSTSESTQEFDALLEYIRSSRGFDFSGYKHGSLQRRIVHRMHMIGINEFDRYRDYLEVHPDEFVYLFNNVLINVTHFFRDEKPWMFLTEKVIPALLAGKKANEPIRVWSAGCSSGEETYTIAMLLAEAVGSDEFKRRVKIYATDIDEDSLNKARLAVYSPQDVEAVPAHLLEKYFDINGSSYVFNKDLRRSIIYGRHDLIQDAPISRIDLLICRNVLMYFNAETQARVLARFHFAMNEDAYLFLGKAEMLLTHANLFAPVESNQRIFNRVAQVSLRDRLQSFGKPPVHAENGEALQLLLELGYDRINSGQIVIDASGILVLANARARVMFDIKAGDIGRSFKDLKLSYQPAELRSIIERVRGDGATEDLKDVLWARPDGSNRYLNINIEGLFDNGPRLLGLAISFLDVTQQKLLQMNLEHANQELETTMEELQSTNEELETTNEELQSTIEELETTNEELQSTNEELETLNEELQSTNEELETINDELTDRTEEINRVNQFLKTILSSLQGSVIVLDNNLLVQAWNSTSEDTWGLRQEEVIGRNFFNLDTGLPAENLRQTIRNVLNGSNGTEEQVLAATTRRGRPTLIKARATPLLNERNEIGGVILLMELVEMPKETT